MKLKQEKKKKKPSVSVVLGLMGVFYITIPAVMTVSCNSCLTVQVITFNSSNISACAEKYRNLPSRKNEDSKEKRRERKRKTPPTSDDDGRLSGHA
jgi:hypothetical protein